VHGRPLHCFGNRLGCYFMAARAPTCNPCSSKHRLSTLSKKGLTMFDSLKKNPKAELVLADMQFSS
jgi:hypothetical protein